MRYIIALIGVCCSITVACLAYANQQEIEQKKVELENLKKEIKTETLQPTPQTTPVKKARVQEEKAQPEPLKLVFHHLVIFATP